MLQGARSPRYCSPERRARTVAEGCCPKSSWWCGETRVSRSSHPRPGLRSNAKSGLCKTVPQGSGSRGGPHSALCRRQRTTNALGSSVPASACTLSRRRTASRRPPCARESTRLRAKQKQLHRNRSRLRPLGKSRRCVRQACAGGLCLATDCGNALVLGSGGCGAKTESAFPC